MRYTSKITEHYTKENLGERILKILSEMGKDLEQLAPEDLAPVSEFHTRGLEATRELAMLTDLKPKMKVLDVGCGIGGPARTLASECGCRMSGIDLTDEYVRTAQLLNQKVGLDKQVQIQQANALQLPFEDESFDVVWTQHAQMNIENKGQFYQEAHRVLKSGGAFAFHDILEGDKGSLNFPVPWARESHFSFLIAPDKLRALLEQLGFKINKWIDKTGITVEWFRQYREKLAKEGPSPLNLSVLLGPEFKTMSANMVQNLEEGRAVVYQGVVKK